MFGRKIQCRCGCGRELKSQEAQASNLAASTAHIVDGLDKVVGAFIPTDSDDPRAAASRLRLAQMTKDGETIESELFAMAHGDLVVPQHSVEEIDSWTAAATQLIGSQAKAMSQKGIDPRAATGWSP